MGGCNRIVPIVPTRLRLALALLILAGLACNLNLAGQSTSPASTAIPTELGQPPASPPPAATEPPPADTAAPSATPLPTVVPTAVSVQALPDPAGYQWTLVAGTLQRPIGLANAGDGRLFVLEQRGLIRVLQEDSLLDPPMLDIRDRVNSSGNEQGLLGLAFHPDFASNGYFYVNYTRAGGDTVVSRFLLPPGATQADPGTEQVLLTIDQPFSNHNGGALVFGPDGTLYISTGDGGSAGDPFGNAQSLDTLLGKLLRIDVNAADPYGIPPDNPFAAGGGKPEIWAYGLRNPWRFSFDPLTDDLYIADVGQGSWEEIDFVPAGSPGGLNFGWNLREGLHPFAGAAISGLIDPVTNYPHSGGACSVTGGEVVRDPLLPAWSGVYVYGDYCSGQVWGLVRDQASEWQAQVLFGTGLNISSFGSDSQGRVYLADRGGGIYRLEATP